MSKKNRLRAVAKEKFLVEYAKHGVYGPALKAIGKCRSTVLTWRKKDKDFDKACNDAYEEAVDIAELELRKRGVEGWDEPVLFKGEPVWKREPHTGELLLDDDFNPIPFTIARKSDRLLEVYTRSHRAIYKEKTELALTNADGSNLEPVRRVEYVLPVGKTVEDYIEGEVVKEELPSPPEEELPSPPEEELEDWLK